MLAIITAVLGGGIAMDDWWGPFASGGLLVAFVAVARLYFERRKIATDALSADVSTLNQMFTQLSGLQQRLLEAERRGVICDQENASLRQRVSRLEAALPLAITEQRISELAGLSDLFNLFHEPLVVTTSADGGTWIWPNDEMCNTLGRTREEILEKGWRAMIHPEDLGETEDVESSAHVQAVWGLVNRFIRADGSIVWFRWYCPPYAGGATIALARVVAPLRRRSTDRRPSVSTIATVLGAVAAVSFVVAWDVWGGAPLGVHAGITAAVAVSAAGAVWWRSRGDKTASATGDRSKEGSP